MKRLSALALIAALSACSKTSEPVSGEAYYKALNCRACHRVGIDGGTSAPDLTTVGLRHNKEWLDAFLKNPQGWKPDTMMPNPRLSDKARGGVVDYLAGLQGQDWAGNPPWSSEKDPVDKGHVVFAKAGCIACHGKAGSGGYPNNNVKGGKIPALNTVSQTYKKDELLKKISRGVKPEKADAAGPAPLVEMPAWGQFLKEDELSAVADYLLSLKGKGAAADAGF